MPTQRHDRVARGQAKDEPEGSDHATDSARQHEEEHAHDRRDAHRVAGRKAQASGARVDERLEDVLGEDAAEDRADEAGKRTTPISSNHEQSRDDADHRDDGRVADVGDRDERWRVVAHHDERVRPAVEAVDACVAIDVEAARSGEHEKDQPGGELAPSCSAAAHRCRTPGPRSRHRPRAPTAHEGHTVHGRLHELRIAPARDAPNR